ncbi:OmpA family protein [Confluentibacter flavum]|uniref:OmpA-like domain-containing protein n=1 Tax=Confluentibacter flavum TaxID=1909700 RepID=A0A2N3HK17_9FLAO|nr:OmpA family protein [Confluentibacter flavum]PKQ45325.1 hypothetical protein CSW08_08915 [Confluentibacter flavum]
MMLHLNTINKFLIVFSLCTVLPASLFAQSENTTTKESTIVMTEAELKSFLSTIADARRAQLEKKEKERMKQDLAELRLKYNEQSVIDTRYNGISNQQIVRELNYLNQRIDDLSSNNNTSPSMGSGSRDNSTIIMPSNSSPSPVYPQTERNTRTFVSSNNNKIQELQNQIDSLKNVESNKTIKNNSSLADSLDNVTIRLKSLRQHLDSLETKMMNRDKMAKEVESPENRTYFKQQVYFDNNSATLNANYFMQIQELTQILVKYPEAKVLLEGWASPVGNSNYNKQLSMRRAEEVEKEFISKGIDPTKILTSFRGEDNSSSEQHARRVDMSIIVK